MGIADAMNEDASRRGERKALADLNKRMPIGTELINGEGTIVIEAEVQPDEEGWLKILEHHRDVSPETHEIDPNYPVEIGSWQMGYTTGTGDSKSASVVDLYRYKAHVRLKAPGDRMTADKIAELTKLVRRRQAIVPVPASGRMPLWYVLCLSDLQLGKASQGGYGTAETIDRVKTSIAKAAKTVKDGKFTGVLICELGDITEGCQGHYDNQAHTVDLNTTDQVDLATEVMLLAIDTFAPLVPRVLIGLIPSNHGELRSGGAVLTDKARDNLDLMIANTLSRVLAANPDRYAHCEVWVPPLQFADPYILMLDLDGIMIGMSHGHQIRTQGTGRMSKLEKFWMDYQWSDRKRPRGETLPSLADADIFLVAHGHTFLLSESTGKLLVQSPASETQSEWWTTMKGNRSSPGVLTFQVSEAWPMLANHFSIV